MSDLFLKYTENSSAEEQIREHLERCDAQFSPALSSRLDIGEYAHKIRDRAYTFEAWEGTTLVGLVAAYCDPSKRSWHITNVSVVPEVAGNGVATRLLTGLMNHAAGHGIPAVTLEVATGNPQALHLYAKFGFVAISEQAGFAIMESTRTGADSRETLP